MEGATTGTCVVNADACKLDDTKNCETCADAPDQLLCKTCVAGYKVNTTTGMCVVDNEACMSDTTKNCASCADAPNQLLCKTCAEGYEQGSSEGTCVVDADACMSDTTKNCETCADAPNQLECGTCPEGYKEPSTGCVKCADGYKKNASDECELDTGICKETYPHCSTCDDSEPAKCASCNTGYTNFANGCTECAAGYKSDGADACVQDTEACKTGTQCATCNSADTTKCATCNTGYTNPTSGCATCAAGYKEGTTAGTCVVDTDACLSDTAKNCATCASAPNQLECGTCPTGYKDVSTGCVECADGYKEDASGECVVDADACLSIEDCKTCNDTNTLLCDACDNDKVPSADKKTCVDPVVEDDCMNGASKVDYCTKCDDDNASECAECGTVSSEKLYPSADKKHCGSCASTVIGCKTGSCSASGCATDGCMAGFQYSVEHSGCVKCYRKIDNCEVCENESSKLVCKACFSQFKLTEGACVFDPEAEGARLVAVLGFVAVLLALLF